MATIPCPPVVPLNPCLAQFLGGLGTVDIRLASGVISDFTSVDALDELAALQASAAAITSYLDNTAGAALTALQDDLTTIQTLLDSATAFLANNACPEVQNLAAMLRAKEAVLTKSIKSASKDISILNKVLATKTASIEAAISNICSATQFKGAIP